MVAGIGLRARHVGELLDRRPVVPWVEVHAENYLANAGALASLKEVRRSYPVALHGVGLSLGSAGPLNNPPLGSLARLPESRRPRGAARKHSCARRRSG